jgi:hypothetical protein
MVTKGFDWLWQELLGNWLFWVLGLAGGSITALLRKYWPTLAGPVLFGLAGFALTAVIVVSVKTHQVMSQIIDHPPITTSNVEENIRVWLDSFNYGVKRADNDKSIFRLLVTSPGGTRQFFVQQHKDMSRYLVLNFNVVYPKSVQNSLKGLSETQFNTIVGKLKMEMVRLKLAFGDVSREGISISRLVPITDQLTEHAFIENVLELEGGIVSFSLIMRTETSR